MRLLGAAVCAYALAMTVANLLVVAFGPAVTPINAFFLIGFDLTLRDWLHVRLSRGAMLALILASGVLTYALNPAAGQIAAASAVAFALAAGADWLAFSRISGSWMRRANGSNVVGAAVDSLVFPTLAFGALLPAIVVAQFVAKVAGGAVWSLVLRRTSAPEGAGAT